MRRLGGDKTSISDGSKLQDISMAETPAPQLMTLAAALDKVRESPSLELLVVTNTIPQEANVATCHKMRCVDVTPTFAEALRCKQERQSMDNVFRMDMFEKLVLS